MKIFEGDIVEVEPLGFNSDYVQLDSNKKYNKVVEWLIYPDCYRGRENEIEGKGFVEWRCSPFTHSYQALEVIGNFHDNPELLYEEWRSPE